MRSFPTYNPSGVGCKGGTSRTAGKKAAVYEWTAPADTPFPRVNWRGEMENDVCPAGTVLSQRTFKLTAETVQAYPWCHEGKWYLGLCDGSWSKNRECITATRIK